MKNNFLKNTPLAIMALSILIMLSTSCQKAKINTQSADNEIVNHLNRGNTKNALDLILQQKINRPNDPKLAFYEASVYCLESGIDIYSIFPLLELKFFREPIINWSNLKKYENPYGHVFDEQDQGPLPKENETNESQKKNQDRPTTAEEQQRAAEADEITKKQKKISDERIQKNLMNAIWVLYESIPIIVKIPNVNLERLDYIGKAISTLENPQLLITNQVDLHNKHQMLSLIHLLMLFTYLKKIISLDKVKEPNDMLCYTLADAAPDYFIPIKIHGKAAALNLINSGLLSKNTPEETLKINQSLETFTTTIDQLPADLTGEEKLKLSYRIFQSQIKRCPGFQ